VKKGIFLLSVIILLIAGWSAGWFFVTGKVETVISDTKTILSDKGRNFKCANQAINGFPFRISINCDKVQYSDEITGVTFEAGQLKTAAQVYQPNKAVLELQSPANLTLPNGDSFNTSWSSMRSSLKTGLSGPERVSLHGKEITLIPSQNARDTFLIGDLQFHGRQIGDDDINLALNSTDTKSKNALWPSFDLTSTFLIKDSYKDIINRASLLRIAKEKGIRGEIERFQYSTQDGGVLEINGPAEVNPSGLLSGNFEITVRDLPKLLNAMSKHFPQEKQKFADASRAIALLSKQTGKEEIKLPITVRQGKISIGILPVGKLPPLF